jgi:SAM-dependent methyltransferase
MTNPTERFTNRAENYAKFRPHYPESIISFFKEELGLNPFSIIADIGSGTGFSSELFLQNGNTVYGIEPNKEMRETGEKLLSTFPKFNSVDASAEQTTLPDYHIDIIIAGQAFHWFDVEKAKKESARILKPDGWVALFWNERQLDSTPFLIDFENLLKEFGTDYPVISEHNMRHKIDVLFSENGYSTKEFPNKQILDYEGLEGRLLSDSYIPTSESPVFTPMLVRLKEIFERHQIDGKVEILYDTDIYYGKIN